ncbi:MAG: methyltransferase domain-containing protein [Actinobacteria bacterium]|nr:methyltransferase domain-containing protein [Actinomycetota bacterium]
MPTEWSPTDREDLQRNYAEMLDPAYRQRWSLENPGNALAFEERKRLLDNLVEGRVPGPSVVLDLGCGSLSALPKDLARSTLIGVDLLFGRLHELEPGHAAALVNADGCMLPLRSGSVDVVVMSVMLSSVLDGGARRQICAEVDRVLSPGGLVVWYDFRYPSPGNRATKRVGRRQLTELFPGYSVTIRSVTVLPPVARALGDHAEVWYPRLRAVPALRSHLAGTLTKPGALQ